MTSFLPSEKSIRRVSERKYTILSLIAGNSRLGGARAGEIEFRIWFSLVEYRGIW